MVLKQCEGAPIRDEFMAYAMLRPRGTTLADGCVTNLTLPQQRAMRKTRYKFWNAYLLEENALA